MNRQFVDFGVVTTVVIMASALDHVRGFWLRPQYVISRPRVGVVNREVDSSQWEWEGVGLPIVASVTLRYVIADIIARLWVAAIDSRSECH